jgi:hypothetical protein
MFRAFLLVLLVVLAAPAMESQTARPAPANKISPEELKNLVHQQLGSKASPSDNQYVIGDFNGDGNSDIAIAVTVEEGRDELKHNNVHYLSADPWRKKNGAELDPTAADAMGQNCLGVALLHGTAAGWRNPGAKYLIYDCFSSFKLFPKSRVIRRGRGSTGPTPKLKGDGIVLDLESGATALIYWSGTTYRGFGIRGGD